MFGSIAGETCRSSKKLWAWEITASHLPYSTENHCPIPKKRKRARKKTEKICRPPIAGACLARIDRFLAQASWAPTRSDVYRLWNMKAFNPYVSHLEELLLASVCLPVNAIRQKQVTAALDGQPSAELRKRVSLDRLRAAGAFFTGSRMAQRGVASSGLPKLEVGERGVYP